MNPIVSTSVSPLNPPQMIQRRSERIMLIGHARHGKDSVCELLVPYGFSFVSSSWILAEEVIFPVLKARHGYKTVQECFDDRSNHRQEWYEELVKYNTPDKARLGRLIYSMYNVYCGLRNRDEFLALKAAGEFDVTVWVDALDRKEPEPPTSMTILKEDADYIIDNNGPEEALPWQVSQFMQWLDIHMAMGKLQK